MIGQSSESRVSALQYSEGQLTWEPKGTTKIHPDCHAHVFSLRMSHLSGVKLDNSWTRMPSPE